MKKTIVFFLSAGVILIAACSKSTNLPAYTPPFSKNFSVTSLKHTQDTVNVGDTIYLTAAGTLADSTSTQNIYAYFSVASTVSGVATTYNFGSAASPVKLSRIVGDQNMAGLYTWTATIPLTGATEVPSKTKLTITGNFIYQLSLSSEQGTLSASDAGVLTKTIFVQ